MSSTTRSRCIAAAIAIGALGTTASAQASVDPTTASQMCAITYVTASVPEFANPTHGQWKAQDRWIATARGGNYAASTTHNTSIGTGSSTNTVACNEDYTFIDGFGVREHIIIAGHVAVGTYSDGTRYPAAFWTDSRDCYGETVAVPRCTL